MSVFEIDPLGDARWNSFIDQHPAASIFHRVEWLQALKSCYGYRPVAFSLNPPDAALSNALVCCEVRSSLTGRRLVSLPFSDHCEPLVGSADEMETLVEHIAEKVKRERWKYFELRPILRHPSGQKLGISHTYYLHSVDLGPSEQILFQRLHKDSIQRKIRRAAKESLRYEKGFSDALLSHFYKLMITTRRRQGLPPQPLKWFRSLVQSLGKDAEIRVAFKDDKSVAGILTIPYKNTLVYKYGCSDPGFTNLGGTALLFWNAITEAKANGMEVFDLGRSDIDNSGLVVFKERWGASRSTLNYWRYPAETPSARPGGAMKHAKRIISMTPDTPLVILGNLLYRHIG